MFEIASFIIFAAIVAYAYKLKKTGTLPKLTIIDSQFASYNDYELAYLSYGGEFALNLILLGLKNKGYIQISKQRRRFKLINKAPDPTILSTEEIEIISILRSLAVHTSEELFTISDLYDIPMVVNSISKLFERIRTESVYKELIVEQKKINSLNLQKFLLVLIAIFAGLVLMTFAVQWWLVFLFTAGTLVFLFKITFDKQNESLREYLLKYRRKFYKIKASQLTMRNISLMGSTYLSKGWGNGNIF